jgi:flagellar export protein FliJ
VRSFSFRLERVRSLRAQFEAAAREALARELATSAERDDELRRADEALAEAVALGNVEDGPLSGGDLLAREAFIARRRREQLAAEYAASAQDLVVSDRQARLETASGELKALERLRERALAEHAREELRSERAALNEYSLLRKPEGAA